MDLIKSYTYILKCADNTYYTGYTTDLAKRIKTHNLKKGAKYTRNRLPVELIYFEKLVSKSEAMKKEYALKKLSRIQKEQYIVANLDEVRKEKIIEINKNIG